MAPSLPKPPMRGAAPAAAAPVPPRAGTPPHKERGHKPHVHAALVNLDTGHWLPPHHPQGAPPLKIAPATPPHVGPMTVIFASKMGHPAMPYRDHVKGRTNVHAHMERGRLNPHPDATAGKIAKLVRSAPPAAPMGLPAPPQGMPGKVM